MVVSESIILVGLIVCTVSPTGVKVVTRGVVGWNNGRIPGVARQCFVRHCISRLL